MKLLYLIAGTYRAAGMERVLANKTNWLAAHGYDIIIATTDQRGRPDAFPMDPRIRTVDLGIDYEENNGLSFLNKLIHYPGKQLRHRTRLKALIRKERPDVVVSLFCNDAGFVPAIANGAKTVLEIHFSRFKRLQYGRRGLWAVADRLMSWNDRRIAARFDRFVVLTEEDASYWGSMPNLSVIPNGRTFTFDIPSNLSSRQVIAVGRYNYQKGFDMLLDAWKMIGTSGWTLRIAGSGDELGPVPENVVTGPSADIRREYMESSILAMSSRYEGLPMVLLEAQAAGLPIVAMACKCGPRDVVTDGVDGFLVEECDVEALAAKLSLLMRDYDLRCRMGHAAYMASDRFDAESVMLRWQHLFTDLCNAR